MKNLMFILVRLTRNRQKKETVHDFQYFNIQKTVVTGYCLISSERL